MAYHFTETTVVPQAIDETSSDQKLPVGTIKRATDADFGEGEFIYLEGVASTAVGSWVTYNSDDGSTALLAADAKGPVAVAMSANVADQYGWYQIQGKAVGLSADVADDADIYSSSVAGTVDDAVVTGDRVQRAKAASDDDTATGTIHAEIERPFVDDGVGGGTT